MRKYKFPVAVSGHAEITVVAKNIKEAKEKAGEMDGEISYDYVDAESVDYDNIQVLEKVDG